MLYKFFLADVMMIAIYVAFYSLIPPLGNQWRETMIYRENIMKKYNWERISQKEIFVHFYHILIYEMKFER